MLVFFGGYYLGRYSGGFNPLVFDENASSLPVLTAPQATGPIDLVALGKRTFANNCVACHQDTGLGLPGIFPPLAGSEWVNAAGHARLVRIVLNGLAGPVEVRGQKFNNVMVPWRQALTDVQIAAVLTYVRQAWGNKGAEVTVDAVKAIREKTKDQAGSWSAEALSTIAENEP
jgi:mono/diheme cytochrome c family protein